MSRNNITASDVIKYLGTVLNIDTQNTLVMDDMIDELQTIHDLNLFRAFIKTNFTEDNYKYLTGYQKFLALVKEFKKENEPRLNINQKVQVQNYSEKLFKKTVDIFDWINWEVQTGSELYDKKISQRLFSVFGKEPRDLQVLEQIGKRAELLRLCNSNKELLREKIEKIVFRLTLEKEYPQLVHKTRDQKILGMLSNGKN